MPFSTVGIGALLGRSFDRAAAKSPRHIANDPPRGQTFFIGGDFAGSHAGPKWETYAFLAFDLERNASWLWAQRRFRETALRSKRRISFKTMNDRRRRAALVPFLQAGNLIDGWLVTFAISKKGGSAFGVAGTEENDPLIAAWKPSVRERLQRILYLSAFLTSGLSFPGQDVLWIIDEDEIASNTRQLTDLTTLFAYAVSNSTDQSFRHLRCGTTRSDNGNLQLEDAIAFADLAAGAVCEIGSVMRTAPRHHPMNITLPLPLQLSWKSRVIADWLAFDESPLRRMTCFIDLDEASPRMTATMIKWNSISNGVVLPPRFFHPGSSQLL